MKDRIVIDKNGTRYILDGREVTEDEYRKVYPAPELGTGAFMDSVSCSAWPMLSDGMAVHPLQIEEARKSAEAKGVPTDFNPEDGRAIFRDRDHRRRYLKAYGVHDNHGGYGDG